jgi:hypothetical protein
MTALESDSEYQTYISNFRKELQNLGWAEGRRVLEGNRTPARLALRAPINRRPHN